MHATTACGHSGVVLLGRCCTSLDCCLFAPTVLATSRYGLLRAYTGEAGRLKRNCFESVGDSPVRLHAVGPHSFRPRSLEPYPLSRIPLGRIPLGRIPISRCPLSRIPFSRTSLIFALNIFARVPRS